MEEKDQGRSRLIDERIDLSYAFVRQMPQLDTT
jgi:hypothetical protein